MPIWITLIVGSVAAGVIEAAGFFRAEEGSHPAVEIWSLAFVVFLAMWVREDSQRYPGVYRPFDYGQLVALYWLPYLPYYLLRTRGLVGVAWTAALLVLAFLGYILQWVVYFATR